MNLETLGRLLALTEVSKVGDKRALQLYHSFNSLEELFSAELDEFDQFHFIDEGNIQELQNLRPAAERYEGIFRQCEDAGISVIGIDDQHYPEELREYHAPLVIYAKGNTDLLSRRSISFAGSRDTDSNGQKWAVDVAETLADDYVIVSGGANGADASAHKGALRASGDTIVVLGTGVENMYPEENRELFNRVLEGDGLIISHQTPDAGPSRQGFLHRNKTNSGLSEAIILVATDGSGGTMSQYSDAVSQGKLVFAPAPEMGFEPTEGISEIVSSGEAHPITSAKDVLETLNEQKEISTNSQASLDNWTN